MHLGGICKHSMDYPSQHPVQPQTSLDQTILSQTVSIDRCDRWQAYYRLQELDIPCACLADGRLQVEVNSPIAALQLRSVFQSLTASRQHLINWLEHCWELEEF